MLGGETLLSGKPGNIFATCLVKKNDRGSVALLRLGVYDLSNRKLKIFFSSLKQSLLIPKDYCLCLRK